MSNKIRRLFAEIAVICICLGGCGVYQNTANMGISGNSIEDVNSITEGVYGSEDSPDILDGTYSIEVTLSGGSGRASIDSPVDITISNGEMTAYLVWSSEHYDYMIVDGVKFLRLNEELSIEGNSVFRIPVSALDEDITVIADTTAMSKPHEIEYTLHFDSSTMTDENGVKIYGVKAEDEGSNGDQSDGENAASITGKRLKQRVTGADVLSGIVTRQAEDGTYVPVNITKNNESLIDFANVVKRRYAKMFTIAYSDDGYYYVHVEQTGDFVIAPKGSEGVSVSDEVPGDMEDGHTENESDRDDGINVNDPETGSEAVVLCKPISNIYLVSTSAMDVFAAVDESLGSITFCSLDKKDWYVNAAVSAFDSGTLKYAGKYSAPDYELLLAGGCDLAIENTMIYHKPEVIEKLNSLGIPVLVEASSYEPHPFGRMEWIKLYGVLTDRLNEAEKVFDEKLDEVEPIIAKYDKKEKAKAAFFYIASNKAVSVRKSSDYVSKMIEMAGGKYVPESLTDETNALSTMNMQMESFYAEAKDADILIYNGAVVGEISTIDDLLDKDDLFADFKAVKTGNVYTTGKNMYQETMSIPMMMVDMNKIFTEDKVSDKELTYLKRVE